MNKGFTGMVESSNQAIDWALAEAIDWALTPRVASTYNIDTKTGIVLFGQSRGGFIVGDLMWNQAFDQSRLAGGIMGNGVRRDHLEFIETISLPCEVCLPMLVMNSEIDRAVSPKHAPQAVADLRSKGVDVTHVVFKGNTHNLKKESASIFEHVADFLSLFETTATPLVGSIDEWPQVCRTGCICQDAEGAELKVADRTACQHTADKLGHRYIQYLASENMCVTSKTCDHHDSSPKSVTKDWEVFWRPFPSVPAPSRRLALESGEGEFEVEYEREGEGEGQEV